MQLASRHWQFRIKATQNDISVYKNLMFMSAEANNGRVDCKPGGVPDPVSKDRMRGVRVFDISDIKNPKLIANVQTCRGSHTHTVLEDPKDKDNVYIYVSGSSGIRSAGELAGCADLAADDPNSSRLRIEIIKVPLANPASAAVVGRANIFAGLGAAPAHGLSDADKEAAVRYWEAWRSNQIVHRGASSFLHVFRSGTKFSRRTRLCCSFKSDRRRLCGTLASS